MLKLRLEILLYQTGEMFQLNLGSLMEVFLSPGTVLESPLAYNNTSDQKRFAVLVCNIKSIQLLLLGVKHIRAYYKKTNNWQGEWLSP